jgi:hypothetical protein
MLGFPIQKGYFYRIATTLDTQRNMPELQPLQLLMSIPQISPSDSDLPNRPEYASVTTSKPYWLAFLVLVVASCTASKPAH